MTLAHMTAYRGLENPPLSRRLNESLFFYARGFERCTVP